MRVPDEFFKELCELANRHGIREVGTSVVRMGDAGEREIELVILSQEDHPMSPESVWQIQNTLGAYGIQRERFPTRTDTRGS